MDQEILARILISDEDNNDILVCYSLKDIKYLGFEQFTSIEKGSVFEFTRQSYKIKDIYFAYHPTLDLPKNMPSSCAELSESVPYNLDIRIIAAKISN